MKEMLSMIEGGSYSCLGPKISRGPAGNTIPAVRDHLKIYTLEDMGTGHAKNRVVTLRLSIEFSQPRRFLIEKLITE